MRVFKITHLSFLEYYWKLTIVQEILYIFIFILFHNNILDYEAPISDWGKYVTLRHFVSPHPDSSAFWSLITKYLFMAKKTVSDSC